MHNLAIMAASSTGYADALTSAFEDVSGQVLGMITATLPFAMSIIGGVMVITIGINVFKKITGKA